MAERSRAQEHIDALIAEAQATVSPRQREIIKSLTQNTTKTTPKRKKKS